MLFSCLVAVRLGLEFGGFGVWVSGCHISHQSYVRCVFAESQGALDWKLWFRPKGTDQNHGFWCVLHGKLVCFIRKMAL